MNFGKHSVMIENPDSNMLASLILLNRHYQKEELREYFKFRSLLLDEMLSENGSLTCHYCGEPNLLREKPVESVRQPDNLATIDHVVPQSKGGGRFDKDNCVVCCYRCNQRKKDTHIDKFEQTC